MNTALCCVIVVLFFIHFHLLRLMYLNINNFATEGVVIEMLQSGTKSIESDAKTIISDTGSGVSDTKQTPKRKETLRRWEIEELMGTRRQTYRRGNGGAYRSRGNQ